MNVSWQVFFLGSLFRESSAGKEQGAWRSLTGVKAVFPYSEA